MLDANLTNADSLTPPRHEMKLALLALSDECSYTCHYNIDLYVSTSPLILSEIRNQVINSTTARGSVFNLLGGVVLVTCNKAIVTGHWPSV